MLIKCRGQTSGQATEASGSIQGELKQPQIAEITVLPVLHLH